MGRRETLGHFDLVVLLAMMRLGEDAYGVSIAGDIEEITGREVALASMYSTLDRLEANGFVRSELGQPTPERGGRAKTYFRITASGLREVRQTRRMLIRLWDSVPQLQGEPS
jgi:PadR family transcriptional regulator PadR